jgi:teichuronic acid biosynthesis glycosyltransferase TuaC
MTMRVLAVTNMYPTPADPAYGAFVASQMSSVSDAGHAVEVDFIDGREGTFEYAKAIPRLSRLAHSGRFDLVHAHYGLSGFVAAFQPLPLVVSFCGDDLLGTPNGRGGITAKSRLARSMSRAAAHRATAIVCKSHDLVAALPRESDRRRAQVIPNGVDTGRFMPGSRTAARAQLGIPEGEALVLFPHTPGERRKRHDLAELALDRLRGRGVQARLWVVAGVPHDRMHTYYQAADCLLLTSDWEGSPNAVKEALCCNLPVVSVDAGDVKRWLERVPGCRLAERTAESIAAGLEETLRISATVNGSVVREQVALDVIARRLLSVYAGVLGKSPARSGETALVKEA